MSENELPPSQLEQDESEAGNQPRRPSCEEMKAITEDIMNRYAETLRVLAKS